MDYRINTSAEFRFRRDILEWLNNQIGKAGYYSSKRGWVGRWVVTKKEDHCVFRFKNQRDAVLFKLTWGGV